MLRFFKRPPVLKAGHPQLRVKAQPVNLNELGTKRVTVVIDEMRQVLSNTQLVGLAAPQLGYNMQIIGYQVLDKQTLLDNKLERTELQFMINPKLEFTSSKQSMQYESCESIPHYSGLVKRYDSVDVKYWDLEQKEHQKSFKGFLARIIQHEYDHLNATLYTDRMDPQSFRHDDYIGEYEVHRKQ
ncbi:peptide deformylase [Gorgonomyces haynaldii]|nr:peptide deformylase [Gorgonomyces haynaldii]